VFTPACAAYVGVVIRQVSEGDGDVAKSFLGKDSRVWLAIPFSLLLYRVDAARMKGSISDAVAISKYSRIRAMIAMTVSSSSSKQVLRCRLSSSEYLRSLHQSVRDGATTRIVVVRNFCFVFAVQSTSTVTMLVSIAYLRLTRAIKRCWYLR
jgi:hypothetical protein